MSHSVLLQISRDSIHEVLEASRVINRESLLLQHPLLNEQIPITLNIYLEEELRGSFSTKDYSLLDAIIYCAKKAAFEDKEQIPLTTSEYLSCEIELILTTKEGVISERDKAILASKETLS